MKSFPLQIITPERRAFSEDVDMVTVPTLDGTVGVLAGHTQLFTTLSEGEVKITQGKNDYFLAIGGGFMQIDQNPNNVTVLVSRAMHADELNEREIEKAQMSARDALKKQVKGDEMVNAQAVLRRAILELKVARRKRSMRRQMPQTRESI